MSGPGGEITDRDRRRESRRQQYQRRQEEARRARQQKIRNQQLRQWGLIGGGAVVLLLLLAFIIHAVTTPSAPPSPYWQHPATGKTIDGFIPCQSNEQVAVHYHSYLKIYINDSQVQVPGGIGIPSSPGGGAKCLYWLHVHESQDNSANNFIHIEAPPDQANTKFTVKNFFDVGGEPLGGTSFMGKTIDASHPLTTEVFDANGKLVQTYDGTDKASTIVLSNHETIVMLYNSPHIKATPNTDWSPVG